MKRFILASLLCLAAAFPALAELTPAQKTAVAANINSDAELLTWWQAGNPGVIAELYNAPASPAFIVWRTSVNPNAILGAAGFDWTRVDNLSTGKARIWDWMTGLGTLDCSRANIRSGIDATWVGTAADLAVRAVVYTECKRTATRIEKVLATGTGSDASPATMGFEGQISPADVQAAMGQ